MLKIFISHPWKHENLYREIKDFLNSKLIPWEDHSIPKNNSIIPEFEIERRIEERIKESSWVIILRDLNSPKSRWMEMEELFSKHHKKNIYYIEIDKRFHINMFSLLHLLK